MITYDKSPFGINLLLRFNGSAIWKATIPGLCSVFFFWVIRSFVTENDLPLDEREVKHPYAVGILVGSISFLLVFRVQIAYARYWEAASAVHHFMSKWMDATMHTAVFHMQCSHYDGIKPPSFYDYPHLNKECLTRAREQTDADDLPDSERMMNRATEKSIEKVETKSGVTLMPRQQSAKFIRRTQENNGNSRERGGGKRKATPLEGQARLDGNWGKLFPDDKSTYFNPTRPDLKDVRGFASFQGGRTAPLFLQELAHLSSLLTGVALSTLRNDIEGAQSPLDIYIPGSPWPAVDPNTNRGTEFDSSFTTVLSNFLYFMGMARSPSERTRYNASRPLPVMGGVSQAEIRFLQMARGPYAKTQLCWAWLSEFITREHLAGSLGEVGPPIISRIIQFMGDGMIYYNHARKIMFIPFPFPHAQLSAYYVLFAVPAVALLMDQYTDTFLLGAVTTFLTVTCLAGIHEVARELENPFRNIPNEIPVVTFQAQYNEALITMFAGFHPDSFWHRDAKQYDPSSADSKGPESARPVTSPMSMSSNDDEDGSEDLQAMVKRLSDRLETQAIELERLRQQQQPRGTASPASASDSGNRKNR